MDQSQAIPNRLESLDWLRGLMALSIMLYHFSGQNDPNTPLGRLGIYGVSVFFILSGLSMAIAYDRYIQDISSSLRFFVRRIFRIWPLLWLAIALVTIPAYFAGEPYELTMIWLNLTTLFGFVAPTEYINMGAWSIGNEMVYYALTPVFIAAYHQRKAVGNLMTLATIGVGLYFAFVLLQPSTPLPAQWSIYINPFNNLCLYCAGLALYYNCRHVEIPQRWRSPLLILAVALFFLYPASGGQISLVTGFNRVAMVILAVSVVLAFYKCAPNLPHWIGNNFEQLGIATYGVYLLHPIVQSFTVEAFQLLDLEIKYLPTLLAIGFTILFSLLIYRLYELPLIKLGKKVTQRRASETSRKPRSTSIVAD